MSKPTIIYKIIYKSYTPALARAQKKYRQTEKGRETYRKARRRQYQRTKEQLKIRVECSHCNKMYSGHSIKHHIKTQHPKRVE